MTETRQSKSGVGGTCRHMRLLVDCYICEVEGERDRLRALLKQAHDRDKWMGALPTIQWYDDVARYFQGKCP